MILLARNLSLDSWILISHVISPNATFLINNLKHTYLLLYLESKSSYIRVKTLVTCSYYTCTFSWYMIVKWPGHSVLLSTAVYLRMFPHRTVVRLKNTDGLKLTSDKVHIPLTLTEPLTLRGCDNSRGQRSYLWKLPLSDSFIGLCNGGRAREEGS